MEWQHSRHNLKMRPSRSPYDYSIGRVFHYTNSLDGYYGTVAVVAHTPCSVLVNDSKRRKQYEIHHQWAKQYLRPYTTFDMFEDDTPERTVFEMFEDDDMLEDDDTSEYLSRYASRSWHGNTGRVNSLFWVEVGTCHCGVVDDAEPDVFRRARRFTNGT